MIFRQFEKKVVKKLNTMRFPEMPLYPGIRILWLRVIDSEDMQLEIFKGEHKHSFIEVHICLDGGVVYDLMDDEVELGEMEGLFITPGTRHSYSEKTERYLKCSLAFSLSEASPAWEALRNCPSGRFKVPIQLVESLKHILEQVLAGNTFSNGIIVGRAYEILYNTICAMGITVPGQEDKAEEIDPRIGVAVDYINANSRKMISSEDVARECGLSVKQMGRIFKKYTDRNLFEFIIETRLKECEKLLLEDAHTIKEIGYLMGFENEYGFNSFFKRHYGMPPGTFKRTNVLKKQ